MHGVPREGQGYPEVSNDETYWLTLVQSRSYLSKTSDLDNYKRIPPKE